MVVAVLIGLGCFATRGLTPPDGRLTSDSRQVTEINEVIDRYLIQYAPSRPSISIDRVTDYLNLGTVILFGFGVHASFSTYRRILVIPFMEFLLCPGRSH